MVSGQREHPPQVRLTLRVGVTGHRDILDTEQLRKAVRSLLIKIRDFATVMSSDQRSLYLETPPVLRVISPLAEGADRLVAEVATDLGFELQCAFPFAEDEYVRDFQTSDSLERFKVLREKARRTEDDTLVILELDGERECSGSAYEAVGHVVLRQSDVLIAIWDGEPARGRGGTALVVQDALRAQIPVVRIDPTHSEIPVFVRSVAPESYGDISELFEHLRSIFLLPQPLDHEKKGIGVDHYLKEKRPTWSNAVVFRFFCKLFLWKIKPPEFLIDFETQTAEQWDKFWASQLEAEVQPQIDRHYRAYFSWADGLAELYGNRYRSSFTLNYLLSALVVLVACLGHFVGFLWKHNDPKSATEGLGVSWTLVEAGLILVILTLTAFGQWKHWYERWLDYRWLAEGLRQMQFLSLLGRVIPSFRVPGHMDFGDPRRNWANWFLRAVVREAGMVAVRVDSTYLADCRILLASVARSQASYHQNRGNHSHSLGARIHFTGIALFWLAALGCALHLADLLCWSTEAYKWGPYFHLTIGLLVLVSPAFGGALAAFSHHGEFERIAARSRALEARLNDLADQIDRLEGRVTSREVGRLAEDLAEILISELVDWRYVFLDKQVALPG